MELVPIKETVGQWKALYLKMARGEKADINDKTLQQMSVEGIQSPYTGQDGQVYVPREAGNVKPPSEKPDPLPEAYEDATIMKTKRGYRKNTKRKSGKAKKRKTTKRKGSRKGTRKTGGRKRSRITKR